MNTVPESAQQSHICVSHDTDMTGLTNDPPSILLTFFVAKGQFWLNECAIFADFRHPDGGKPTLISGMTEFSTLARVLLGLNTNMLGTQGMKKESCPFYAAPGTLSPGRRFFRSFLNLPAGEIFLFYSGRTNQL
jgi:hypothetical protein